MVNITYKSKNGVRNGKPIRKVGTQNYGSKSSMFKEGMIAKLPNSPLIIYIQGMAITVSLQG